MIVKIFLFLLLAFSSCNKMEKFTGNNTSAALKGDQISSDTLHVATLYGSSSYFHFRNDVLGYDVDLATHFAQFAGRPLRVHVATSQRQLYDMLRSGRVDLIAHTQYETRQLRQEFAFVAWQEDSYMVLVQRIGLNTVTELTELRGKTIHVIENSVEYQRLKKLKKELGGQLTITTVSDTVSRDELIERVAQHKIDYTVAHHKLAVQHQQNNRRLDARVALGFHQRNGWIVRKRSTELISAIAEWESSPETELAKSQLYGRYMVRNPYFAARHVRVPKGAISPYDEYFKKYAAEINWDWRLLASIAFHESNFDSAQISRRGAAGLMQLMPRTAASLGLDLQNIHNPEKNIEAGVQYIKSLNMMFRKIENLEERRKFILAAYNSGPAHVMDAMALAEKHGRNPHLWFGHVEYFLTKKQDPEYYNDEVVRYGAFRADETVRYVRNTLNTFNRFKGEG